MLQGNWEQLDVPITIAFWDKPCGEACQRDPIAAMVVVRSPLEPAIVMTPVRGSCSAR